MRWLAAAEVVVLISMVISTLTTQRQDPNKAVDADQKPAPENLTCHCTEDGTYVWPGGQEETIQCDGDFCSMLAKHKDKGCLIETTISEWPYKVRQTCSNLSEAESLNPRHVIVAWTTDQKIVVFRKCKHDYCNHCFYDAGLPRLESDVETIANRCLPISPVRTSHLLKVRRNFSEDLTCSCTVGGTGTAPSLQCEKDQSRCGSAKFDPAKKDKFVCQWTPDKMTCEDATQPSLGLAPTHVASYFLDETTGTQQFLCRSEDQCNAGLPEGKDVLSLEDAVCHWTCPKMEKTKWKLQWWHFTLISAAITVICCGAAFFGTQVLRFTIRLQN